MRHGQGGIVGFTTTAAKELARFGITVNAISPNAETRMIVSIPPERRKEIEATTPLGRFGDPSEMAAAVASWRRTKPPTSRCGPPRRRQHRHLSGVLAHPTAPTHPSTSEEDTPMREAVVVSTARTPIGRAYRGSFNDTQAQHLAAHALSAALERAGVEGGEV